MPGEASALQPVEVKVAVQIAIDTRRRPEDILGLALDCLARDKDGASVLVYDNAKAHRLGRPLPVSQATATVITGQQDRVRPRFPGTPVSELKLLPAARRNPDGRRPMTIDMLEGRHRKWVDRLGPLRTRDGSVFDTTKIMPICLSAYLRPAAGRRRDAHARYAVGEVADPAIEGSSIKRGPLVTGSRPCQPSAAVLACSARRRRSSTHSPGSLRAGSEAEVRGQY